MNESNLKIEARTVFAFIFVFLGAIIILVGVIQAFLGVEHITKFIDVTITDTQALLEVFGWFFMLLIEILGGYFLASIGIKIYKK